MPLEFKPAGAFGVSPTSGGLREGFERDLVTEAIDLGDEPSGLPFGVAFAEGVAAEVAV